MVLIGPRKPLVCIVVGKTWLAYSHHCALIETSGVEH